LKYNFVHTSIKFQNIKIKFLSKKSFVISKIFFGYRKPWNSKLESFWYSIFQNTVMNWMVKHQKEILIFLTHTCTHTDINDKNFKIWEDLDHEISRTLVHLFNVGKRKNCSLSGSNKVKENIFKLHEEPH